MSYSEIVFRELLKMIFGGKIKRTGNKYKKPKMVSK